MIRDYYQLTKPGIIRANVFTAIAGFLFASVSGVDFRILFAVIFGVTSIIASACVFNNVIDREIDSKMKRTKHRALVIKSISVKSAKIFGTFLGIIGFSIILFELNHLTFLLGLIAYINYIFIYGHFKRNSSLGTIVGSVSGALPILAGYVAIKGSIDVNAALLFLFMVVWQMPHFYSIAIFRRNDYANASLPVLSISKSVAITKIRIVEYIAALLLVVVALGALSDLYFLSAGIVLLVCIYWFWLGISGIKTNNDIQWAKKMFFVSLIVLAVFSFVVCINNLIV